MKIKDKIINMFVKISIYILNKSGKYITIRTLYANKETEYKCFESSYNNLQEPIKINIKSHKIPMKKSEHSQMIINDLTGNY